MSSDPKYSDRMSLLEYSTDLEKYSSKTGLWAASIALLHSKLWSDTVTLVEPQMEVLKKEGNLRVRFSLQVLLDSLCALLCASFLARQFSDWRKESHIIPVE